MNHVAQTTRQKVYNAAKKLDYTISKSASALATGKTHRIALLARESIGGWFMGELLDGLYDILRPAGYDILIFRASSPTERKNFFHYLPAARNADALIVTGFTATRQESSTLTALGMPIVAVNSPTTSFTQASLAINDRTAEATIIRYLAALKHKNFAYVARRDPLQNPETKSSNQQQWGYDLRVHGYRDEITKLHLHNCGIFTLAHPNLASATQTIAEILAQPIQPTAICAWSDRYALALLQALLMAGIRVPDDISLFGFDGSDYAKTVGLSTISQPARQTGRQTASMVLKLIQGERPQKTSIIIPTHLMPGVTSGPASYIFSKHKTKNPNINYNINLNH